MSQPAKEKVRDWMARRQKETTPPPSGEEIRKQLVWCPFDQAVLPRYIIVTLDPDSLVGISCGAFIGI